MKHKILILFFLFSGILQAQEFFTYKLSKPYCIFNFMNTATNRPGTSSTLRKYIETKTANDTDFKKLCDEFTAINLHYNIERDGFPESRNQNSSTYNLVAMNMVNADNLQDFKVRCIGILPLNDNQKLFEVLTKAEKIYDKVLWKEYEGRIKNQLRELSKFARYNSDIFTIFSNFYQTGWTKDIPFQVAIYPIPGKTGNTTATPHVNSLCIGVLTDETNYSSRNGVVLHEMCHIMFNEQSAEVQNKIDGFFNGNPSSYAKIAYSYFDEALATALGNGWAYKKANGKPDETSWYNNVTIDGFAKALFPSLENYLDGKKAIDKDFIDNAVIQFAAKFPNSIYDYSISFNALVLYTDNNDNTRIRTDLKDVFWVSSFNVSSPIMHPYSIEMMNESRLTQFFVITENHQEKLEKLKEIFPELGKHSYNNKSENLSFIDKKGRVVILLILTNLDELKRQLERMKENEIFDPQQIIQK
ncbi:MAG: hypothetical protein M0D53_07790 [Flavobacterium sp. JAD_PAG50586_2]|nr:MAG: hypothetical protein M0D53_07790 [Flavobacterium sp. JAD_PAG50586_2]